MFLAQYPEVSLDLVAEGFDAGFRLGDAVPRDMVAVRFGEASHMRAVASPAYMRDRQVPQSPDDLAQHRCIRSRSPAGRPYKWEFERHGHELTVDVPGALMLNRTELMLQAALKDMGIAFVPERLARPYLAAGQLVSLLDSWCPNYPGLYLYYPGHRQVSAALRAFIDMLKAAPEGRTWI